MALLLALVLVTAAPPPSTNPYVASMRYAECLRAHGVPHPNPDRSGNFSLTPVDEKRLRAVGHDKVLAADKACFHHLKGLNNRPLTPQAKRRALGVLRELSRCIAGYGFQMGKPVVENKPRGRAFFGFETGPPMSKALATAQHTCEKRVDLAGKIDRIVAEDRSGL